MDSIRLIALDLDNTTLNGESRLTPRTRDAIERALSLGVEVVIASGRSRRSLPRDVLSIKGLRYAVTSNGAAVYDLRRDCAIHRLVLPAHAAGLLMERVDPAFELQAFIDGQGYASERYLADPGAYSPKSAVGVEYLKRTRRAVADMRGFVREHRGELDMLDLVLPGGVEREPIIERLKKEIPGVYVTASMRHLIEIVHRDCGKRAGVAWLGGQLGLVPRQIAAFGDAENDREMLEYAGLGCAVENAEPAVRAAADLIVPSNLEDGVAWGIEKILDGSERG